MKFSIPKQSNNLLNSRLKKVVFALLALVSVLVLIYPFYPQPYSDIYYEAYKALNPTTTSAKDHYVVLKTPNYVLVGTEAEQLARLRSGVDGFDAFQEIDWNATEQDGVNNQHTAAVAGQLIIEKIGVDMPISTATSSEQGLEEGAWLIPGTSTPDRSSNTALAGHRFKYLPPSSKTLYLLDKLEIGDEIIVHWKGSKYTYTMSDSEVVLPSDVSVLNATSNSVLTLVTCTPVFSTDYRLIVTADLARVD